jgi:hypothetical protein
MRTIAIANQARITTAVGDDAVVPREANGFPYNYSLGSTESCPQEIFLRGSTSWRLVSLMPSYDHEPEKTWDEYDWERFLQQQDHKTEKYMELLEKYIDHPRRDQIIAREMGWTQLLDGKANDWSEEIDALLAEDDNSALEDDRLPPSDQVELPGESFEDHVLYRAAFALTVWIDQLFDENAALQNEPSAVKLATHAALAGAKLAAALSDDDADELGMTIAYLKRALKAITVAMDGGAQLLAEKLVDPQQYAVLQQRLFQVRDGIILLMGEYRGEWLRRYGNL